MATYVLPTVTATTPTVVGGVTYGIWAMQPCIIVVAQDENGPADPSGPHSPLMLKIGFTKGRIHPDGYFESCPGLSPVVYEQDDVIAAAQGSLQLQNILTNAVSFFGTRAKNAGLI